jgi:hypothetical protein
MLRAGTPLVELQALTNMSAMDARDYGEALHGIVVDPTVQRDLTRLHLPGVILRHGSSVQESGAKLVKSRINMANGVQESYVLRSTLDGEVGRLLGMASVQPALSLHLQDSSRPRADWAGNERGRQEVDTSDIGANVAVWVDARHRDQWELVREAYMGLREQAGRHIGQAISNVWTLLPAGYANPYGRVLEEAGFQPENEGYYDDQGAPGSQELPYSVLYVARQALAAA